MSRADDDFLNSLKVKKSNLEKPTSVSSNESSPHQPATSETNHATPGAADSDGEVKTSAGIRRNEEPSLESTTSGASFEESSPSSASKTNKTKSSRSSSRSKKARPLYEVNDVFPSDVTGMRIYGEVQYSKYSGDYLVFTSKNHRTFYVKARPSAAKRYASKQKVRISKSKPLVVSSKGMFARYFID